MDEFEEEDVELAELAGQLKRSIPLIVFLVDMILDKLRVADSQHLLQLIKLPQYNIPMNGIRHLHELYQTVPCFNLDVFFNWFFGDSDWSYWGYLLGHLF